MKSYFKQVGELLAINLRMKYKTLLFFGILVYAAIYLLVMAFPGIFEIIVGMLFSGTTKAYFSIKRNVLLILNSWVLIINAFVGTYFVLKNYMMSKKEFVSQPYDMFPKITALYIYMALWVTINMFSRWGADFFAHLFYWERYYRGVPFSNIQETITSILFTTVFVSLYLILYMLWDEKSFLYNMVIFIAAVIIMTVINTVVQSIYNNFGLINQNNKDYLVYIDFRNIYKNISFVLEVDTKIGRLITFQAIFASVLYMIFGRMNIKETYR